MKHLGKISIILCRTFLLLSAISLAEMVVWMLSLLINNGILTSLIALALFVLYNELFTHGYKALENGEEVRD